MTKLIATLLGLFFLAAPARAHFYLEPDLGFELGSATQNFTFTNAADTHSTFNRSGSTFGAALGYRYNRWYGGLQAEKCAGGHVTDFTALIGVNLEIKFRFWLGYIFSTKDDVSSGYGFKAGLGFPITRIFRLNGEYATRTYGKYTALTANTLTYKGTLNTFKVTLSVPFQL